MTSDWTPATRPWRAPSPRTWAPAAESFWHEAERIARAHLYPSGCRTCACCGFPEMDATPVCGECRKAGCEPGRSGSYPDCQRDGMDDL